MIGFYIENDLLIYPHSGHRKASEEEIALWERVEELEKEREQAILAAADGKSLTSIIYCLKDKTWDDV